MTDSDNVKATLRFWIAALAFSVLLLAITFAVLAGFLADIKANTSAALLRTDIMSERLNILGTEISAINRHIVEAKIGMNPIGVPAAPAPVPVANPAPVSAPVPAPAATTDEMAPAPLVKDVTPAVPAAAEKAAPAIQVPTMGAPTTPSAPPAAVPAKP